MPLRPVTGKLSIPVRSASDVYRVFEAGLALSQEPISKYALEDARRDLDDHFFYIGAVIPEAFRPLQEAVVKLPTEQIRNFAFTHHTWLYLLYDAPDACVEHLVRRLNRPDNPSMVQFALQEMLMGICTPAALEALATYARETGAQADVEAAGFWIPPDNGPAVPRFARERWAARVESFDGLASDLRELPHPVGLPLDMVMDEPEQDLVVWHYCTVKLDGLIGMPKLRHTRLHLVSPPLFDSWTVFTTFAPDGRYTAPALSSDTKVDDEEMTDLRAEAVQRQGFGKGQLTLLPYDDHLVYRNGHVMSTPGVEGDVGGPPIGVYPNPTCTICSKLMFHVATFTKGVREFGDGFRCLYVCEDCMVAASQGVGWN